MLYCCFPHSNKGFLLAVPRRGDHWLAAAILRSGRPHTRTFDASRRWFRRRWAPVTLAARRGLSDVERLICSHPIVLACTKSIRRIYRWVHMVASQASSLQGRYTLAPSAHRNHASMVERARYCTQAANTIPDDRVFCCEYTHSSPKFPQLLTCYRAASSLVC